MPLHFLSDDDVAVLQRLLGTEQNRIVNTPTRLGTESSWSDKEDHQATQTYVAKPITGGIPARASSLEPGKALCDLYRIILDSAGDPTLEQMDLQQKLVYNLTASEISSDFISITKAKSGHWVASSGGSAGTEIIHFDIVSASPAIGQGFTGCDFVTATVTQVSCSSPSVAIGEEVNIWDPNFCLFNIPITLLIGLPGVASLMENQFHNYELASYTDCEEALILVGECRWIVSTLCCAEEVSYGA